MSSGTILSVEFGALNLICLVLMLVILDYIHQDFSAAEAFLSFHFIYLLMTFIFICYKRLFFQSLQLWIHFLSVMNKHLHATLLKICTSDGNTLFTAERNKLLTGKCQYSQSLICLNRWKHELYSQCSVTVQSKYATWSIIFKLVQGLAL